MKVARIALVVLVVLIAGSIILYGPCRISEPGASPDDPAKEDLTRIDYPSLASFPWKPHFIRPNESLESLFGRDWSTVARFNRVDRRHVYPGMTIKVPTDMAAARGYSPLPQEYAPARRYGKYILVSLTEQWMGAYEHGQLKFSMPAATGAEGHKTPVGLFRVDARHRNHTSSLYKTEDETAQYPMDNAIRFHVGEDNVSYWIHARDLPGKPASHGCVGLYDEEMQNRIYGIPAQPVLNDSQRLYSWAVGANDYEEPDMGDLEEVEDGPVVEVAGDNPVYRAALPSAIASSR